MLKLIQGKTKIVITGNVLFQIIKKNSEKEIRKAHKKIKAKVHPDVSKDTARLAAIVNGARDTILKNL